MIFIVEFFLSNMHYYAHTEDESSIKASIISYFRSSIFTGNGEIHIPG